MNNANGAAPDRGREFGRLVELYQGPVLRMCVLTLRDKTLAEDATQETFLKVYRALDTFRGESSEKAWIMKIAVHTCWDINRSAWFRFMNFFSFAKKQQRKRYVQNPSGPKLRW